MKRIELENSLSKVMRDKWGDNAVEALVGALSSITTEEQLKVLIEGNK